VLLTGPELLLNFKTVWDFKFHATRSVMALSTKHSLRNYCHAAWSKVVTDICVVGRLVWRNVDEYLFSAEPDPAAKRLTRAVCQATLFSFEVGNLAIKRAN
jgi:hypothetical protein